MDVQEVRKLDAYLKRLFGNPRIRVVPRPKKDDSAEVYLGEEFIGVHVRRRRGRRAVVQFPDGDPGDRSRIAVFPLVPRARE